MKTWKNIILIDDNKIDLFVHQKVIEKFDVSIKVRAFTSAVSALSFFDGLVLPNLTNSEIYPDAIMLDLNMPEMNGFQFLNEIKKLKIIQKKTPQIYLLSSSTLREDIEKARENELCSKYINKPLTLEKITILLTQTKPNLTLNLKQS